MKLTDIRLHDVSRRFGRHHALRNVSVTFKAGQIVLLLGPNGAGKTTLLRILSTLLRPSRGVVTATLTQGEREVSADWFQLATGHRGLLGLVSHASLIYHDLTARENLMLFGELYGLSAEVAEARSRQLLDELELSYAADRRVAEYSRGMRQRLSIARALLQSPSVVLLDEPFTGLDQSGNRILHGVLRRLREEGKVVLMITHHLEQPPDIIDRAILLYQGRLARDADPDGEPLGVWYERGLQEVTS